MTIQAVFFDMGGTIETFNYTRELRLKATLGIQQILFSAGIDLHLSQEQLLEVVTVGLNRYHKWRLRSLVELPAEQVWCKYILAGYAIDTNALGTIAEDLTLYVETRYYHRKMRPEIPTVLKAIQQMGVKIGLISNVSSRGQVPTNLIQYGIQDYFDPIVLSCVYGRRKPDPAIFHYAARLANVPTSECVYVGDRISRDIVGARKAGYNLAIQIQHDFKHDENDEGATPDVVISRMTELLTILQGELNRSTKNVALSTDHQKSIRSILFDAGDILYFRPRKNIKFKTFLEGLALDSEDNHTIEKTTLTKLAFQGQINQDQYREAILRMYGVSQLAQIELGKRILDEDDQDIQFYEGVPQTLSALKEKGYLLGVITDTANPLHVKLSWFEKGGFGNVWDSLISSKEIGVCKPDPKIYEAALKQLGVQPNQAVFVGHRASELDGAKAMGMQTIAFNYDESASADYYIEKFSDLLCIPLLCESQSNPKR
jgi:HAD superfamily hydrolase (TIGR01549 family)/HAD superfamily hydrolase (TIGR01509 family)